MDVIKVKKFKARKEMFELRMEEIQLQDEKFSFGLLEIFVKYQREDYHRNTIIEQNVPLIVQPPAL